MKSKQDQLDALAAKIKADAVCPELAAQATQLVFGDGNPDADIVLIGEAPGKNEDLQGKPFVGASGKFLGEMLEMIGMKREDIYITNIVKYRPPNNRDPLPEEKAAFLPYLSEQLAIIKPKLIVTLGRHSMDVLLPSAPTCASCRAGGSPEQCLGRANDEYRKDDVAKATSSAERNRSSGEVRSGEPTSLQQGRSCSAPLKISQVHGEPKRIKLRLGRQQTVGSSEESKKQDADYGLPSADYQSWVILPLFHPAAALYNGAMRQTLIDDFALIPAILKKINN